MTQLPSVRADIVELASGRKTKPEEFQARVLARSQELVNRGVSAKDLVYLPATFDVGFLVEFFALLEIGAVACLADRDQTAAEREAIENMLQPGRLELPDGAALIIFTSGTSATPKAVVHTYENLAFRFESSRLAIGEVAMESTIVLLPLHFGHGFLGVCLSALFQGKQLLLPPDLSMPTFSKVGQWVDEYGITFLSGTPATWSFLLRFSKPPVQRSLRRVQIASAHAASKQFSSLQTWAGCDVWNVYGTSETASWVSDCLMDSATPPNAVGNGKNWRSQFEILNPDQNGHGEVRIHTRSLFYGYLGEKLEARTSFDTKDLGWIDEDGRLRLEGRMVRVINLGGLKVSAEEVELRLRENSEIADAFVLSAPSVSGLSSVGALLVLREGLALGAVIPRLVEDLRRTLSPHKIPTVWKSISSIPRRSNGKPDLKEIGLQWDKLT